MGCISTVCSSNYVSEVNLFLLVLQRTSATHSYSLLIFLQTIRVKKLLMCTKKPEKLIRQGKLKYPSRHKQSQSSFQYFPAFETAI